MLHTSAVLLFAGIGVLVATRYQLLGTAFHIGRMIWFIFLILSVGFFLAELILRFRNNRS